MTAVDGPHAGQACPQAGCDGVLRVESTKVLGDYRRRYFKCKKCGRAPANNVQCVPLRYAPPQAPRQKTYPPTSYL